ncbi:hypothetical protein EV360DRAFT_76344 [Lentinula raphanica]|nr:hypothetical protein EV360DRAFT_76344 [Lentinula raphanica]
MTSNIFSAIVLFAQSIPLAAGSYGGVTGIDSIARSVCALVDQTIGPLLLYGLLNLCYPDLQIPFFNLEFHTQRINVYGFNGSSTRRDGNLPGEGQGILPIVPIGWILGTLFHVQGDLESDGAVVVGRHPSSLRKVSSVLTYSLDYKGICSWAAPKTYGTPWTRREQIQCRNRVLHCMGKMYHAHAVFRFAAWLWPKITTAKIGKRWPDILGKEGFRGQQKYPPTPLPMIQSGFETRLQPNPTQQRYNFLVMGPLCIFNVLAPFVLIWRDGQSANPFLTLLMSSFFQVAVLILNYKDLDDQSINCRFEAIPQSVQDYPSSPLGSNSRMAKGRLSTQRDTRVDALDRTGTKHESMSTAMLRADSSAAETFVHVQEDDEAEGIRDRKGKSKAVN